MRELSITTKYKRPLDEVIAIENRRLRLGIKKNVLCDHAGIKPEMYSYVLKRGDTDQSLPAETMEKIYRALDKLEAAAKKGKLK